MGWFALAGAALQVGAQQQQSSAQQTELKAEARQEKLAATDREVQRQRRLNAILGSQNAAIAASGIVNSGSVANISLVDARRASEDSQVDQVNTSTRIASIHSTARSIRRATNIRSAGTLFQAAGRAYERGRLPNKPAPQRVASYADVAATAGLA